MTLRVYPAASAVLASLLLICVAYWVVARAAAEELFNHPGVTWANGWLSGEEIHLLPTGEYASRMWSDVGNDEEHRGRWAAEGKSITLRSEDGSARTLHVMHFGDCTFLLAAGSTLEHGRPNPFEAYSQWPQRCASEL